MPETVGAKLQGVVSHLESLTEKAPSKKKGVFAKLGDDGLVLYRGKARSADKLSAAESKLLTGMAKANGSAADAHVLSEFHAMMAKQALFDMLVKATGSEAKALNLMLDGKSEHLLKGGIDKDAVAALRENISKLPAEDKNAVHDDEQQPPPEQPRQARHNEVPDAIPLVTPERERDIIQHDDDDIGGDAGGDDNHLTDLPDPPNQAIIAEQQDEPVAVDMDGDDERFGLDSIPEDIEVDDDDELLTGPTTNDIEAAIKTEPDEEDDAVNQLSGNIDENDEIEETPELVMSDVEDIDDNFPALNRQSVDLETVRDIGSLGDPHEIMDELLEFADQVPRDRKDAIDLTSADSLEIDDVDEESGALQANNMRLGVELINSLVPDDLVSLERMAKNTAALETNVNKREFPELLNANKNGLTEAAFDAVVDYFGDLQIDVASEGQQLRMGLARYALADHIIRNLD